jgi:hypothetical protein
MDSQGIIDEGGFMVLAKDAILSADDLKTETVEVPQWGGSVKVRMMTGVERDAFEESCIEVKGNDRRQNFKNLRAKLCAMCIVDDDGNRLFTDDEAAALGKKSAAALDLVFTVAQRLNGMGAKEVAELTKN